MSDYCRRSGLSLKSSVPYLAISFIMVLSLVFKLYSLIINDYVKSPFADYGYTEFLINFRGGFVRRGLLGEILLRISETFGIHPKVLILTISTFFFLVVVGFMAERFRRGGYCRWMLFSPILCGMLAYVVRKDFLLYADVMLVFTLVKSPNPALWQRLCAFLLAMIGLLLHEAFIFWGVPILALVLWADRRHRIVNMSMIAVLGGIFLVLCRFKGDSSTALAIIDSWNGVIPGTPLEFAKLNSIGALTWDTLSTMVGHIMLNIGQNQIGVVYWPVCYAAVYYFLIFFFKSFPPKRAVYGRDEQTRLSVLILTVSICLLPMFALLSCDYGRLFQYIGITSFAAYFCLDPMVQRNLVSPRIYTAVERMNIAIGRRLPPSRGLLVVMLLFIGVSPYWFNLAGSWLQSPFGAAGECILGVIRKILHSYLV